MSQKTPEEIAEEVIYTWNNLRADRTGNTLAAKIIKAIYVERQHILRFEAEMKRLREALRWFVEKDHLAKHNRPKNCRLCDAEEALSPAPEAPVKSCKHDHRTFWREWNGNFYEKTEYPECPMCQKEAPKTCENNKTEQPFETKCPGKHIGEMCPYCSWPGKGGGE